MGPELGPCQTNLQPHWTTFDTFSEGGSQRVYALCYGLSDLCKHSEVLFAMLGRL